MSLITQIRQCFQAPRDYSKIQKKDDEFGRETIQYLEANYPASDEITHWNFEKIKDYIIRLIRDLERKEVPITTSNIGEIKEHLAKLAQSSARLQPFLKEKLESSSIDKWAKKELIIRVAFTCTNRA